MGNLYRLNSLFELEISRYPKTLDFDKTLLERSTAFEYLFLLLSQPEDYTLLSESPSEELLEYWDKINLPHGNSIQTSTPYFAKDMKLDKGRDETINLMEWGKTSELNQDKTIIEKKEEIVFASKYLNSKINQTQWKESHKFNSLTSVICSNKMEIELSLTRQKLPLVVKGEFGFSGRGHFILRTELDVANLLQNMEEIFRLNPNGVIVEEWVEESKIHDFSGLYEVSTNKINLLAITRMLVDKNGTYRGSIIQKNFGWEFETGMSSIVKSYFNDNSHYTGALSMDGFTFLRENKVEVQSMSEINFRYSMGRVLFELHRKLDEENDEYALLFYPVKSKTLSFEFFISSLARIQADYKSEIILLTPLMNSKLKKNKFLGFYVCNKKKIPVDIFEMIKRLLI